MSQNTPDEVAINGVPVHPDIIYSIKELLREARKIKNGAEETVEGMKSSNSKIADVTDIAEPRGAVK